MLSIEVVVSGCFDIIFRMNNNKVCDSLSHLRSRWFTIQMSRQLKAQVYSHDTDEKGSYVE
jgi:hypothetical protein